MHRKITRNLLCLGGRDFDALGDCVSMSVVNAELIIMPYQAGDENREERIISTPDCRGRIRLPGVLMRAAGITDYVDIVIDADMTIHVTPLAKNKIGLRRANKYVAKRKGE